MTSTIIQWIYEWIGLSEGNFAQVVFRCVAVIGLLMAFLQLIFRLFGFDHDVDIDFDTGGHGDAHILSWTTLSGFMLGFGAVGSMLLTANHGIPISALGGAGSGFAVAAVFYFLMRAFSMMKEDNTFNIQSSVGQIGTAYIRIPARQNGGQVQVVAQSRLVTLSAISDDEIPSGEKVRILEVIGSDTVKVERV